MSDNAHTTGYKTKRMKEEKGSIFRARERGLFAAIVFGVISEHKIISTVITSVAIPTPSFPNALIAKAVAMLDDKIFRILFPISNVVSILDGSSRILDSAISTLCELFFNCRLCVFVIEVRAVSAAEKIAERKSSVISRLMIRSVSVFTHFPPIDVF